MKLDLRPVRAHSKAGFVTPRFDGDDSSPMDPALRDRMRRPMMVGGAVIGVFILGLGLWASLTPLASGVTAPAQVRVESNRKTIRHREGGVVRQILVKEGQRVRAGQPLILFDDVETRAGFDVLRNQYDSALAQSARFQAESSGRPQIDFPAELTARISDPRVADMIRDQQMLFASRLQLFQSQVGVMGQRLEQIQTQVGGLQAQVDSIDEQRRLTEEELAGYRTLHEKGYAPKTLILRYERTLADLAGRKGALVADIARMRQQMGETRLQMGALREQRESQAAEGLRDSQQRLADVGPRFTATKQALEATVVRSPVEGYVFNLTQFTDGGVTGPGELLMDIVPANAPLLVSASISPQDRDDVHVGMDAKVRLVGLNQRFHSPLPAKVVLVSADAIPNEKTGLSTYRADLRIDPKDLAKLERGVTLSPGMPADAMIVTGKRTVMGYLILPITETLQDAFRER